jgi:DNA-binding transcriptional regulator YhcF (GntR family)
VANGFVAVDLALDTPPFQQIFEQVRAAVERGDLEPGAVLPTVRQLAGDLGVAPNTVARAYAELQEEGLIVADGRRGTRVAPKVPAANGRARTGVLRDALDRTIAALRHRGYSPAEIRVELERAVRAL